MKIQTSEHGAQTMPPFAATPSHEHDDARGRKFPGATIVLILIVSFFAATTCAAEVGYKAKYKLSLGGLTIAKMERQLEIDEDGHYRFVSKIKASGLAAVLRSDELEESSSGRLVEGRFQPEIYTYERANKRKPRSVRTEFNYADGGSIHTVYNGESRDQSLREGMLDKLVYQAALASDLAAGKNDLRYVIADRGKERIYEPLIAGEEIIKTNFGEFATTKVIRATAGDQRRTIFWCAPTLDYLPVRVAHRDKDGDETIVAITDYEVSP